MKLISDVTPTARYGGAFSGAVDLRMLREAVADTDADLALVTFHDGAVTAWHSHPGGQLIWVVSGRALVGTVADGATAASAGTLIVCAPGESHWHGAAAGGDAELLCFTYGHTSWTDRLPDDAARP